ncbi:MAG: hypothetical protein ACRYG7_18845 [Janthinobacterium lividum]
MLLHYSRYLHIGAGFIGFFVAPVALAVRKGGLAHRRWGQVFFWAMVVAGSTAILNASFKGMTFLLLTGVFSLYLAIFGYRALYQKHLSVGRDAGARPAPADWLLVSLGLLVFSGTLIYGMIYNLIPSVVFGLIGVALTGRQLAGFRRRGPWPAGQWLLNHMSGFVGAYIAAVSAFSATSLHFIPWPWNFLWPTLVLVPPLVWVSRRYKARFAQGQRPAEVVEVRIQPTSA